MTVFLTLLAVGIAFVLGCRSGFGVGYRAGVSDTVGVYRVLHLRAAAARKELEGKTDE